MSYVSFRKMPVYSYSLVCDHCDLFSLLSLMFSFVLDFKGRETPRLNLHNCRKKYIDKTTSSRLCRGEHTD